MKHTILVTIIIAIAMAITITMTMAIAIAIAIVTSIWLLVRGYGGRDHRPGGAGP